MTDNSRVVTANLPEELVSRLDTIADRIERSKSWIIRQALNEWLTEEERRHQLTLEGLNDLDQGRAFTQAEVEAYFAAKRKARLDAEP